MAKSYNPADVSITTRVDREFADRLDEISAQRRFSRSDIIRELLMLGLERYEQQRRLLAAVS